MIMNTTKSVSTTVYQKKCVLTGALEYAEESFHSLLPLKDHATSRLTRPNSDHNSTISLLQIVWVHDHCNRDLRCHELCEGASHIQSLLPSRSWFVPVYQCRLGVDKIAMKSHPRPWSHSENQLTQGSGKMKGYDM